MIVVARFSFPHEAHIARASLDSVGIESYIADEHTVNTQWLYSNAIGGVRLMVAESDAEDAKQIQKMRNKYLVAISQNHWEMKLTLMKKKTFALNVVVKIYLHLQKVNAQLS